MKSLAAAYEQFRRGDFTEAHRAARALGPNFWADYIAAICSAFAANLKDFQKDLAVLEAWGEKTVYLEYLKAYQALLAGDSEKALWHYLQIVDEPEGWLAKSIVKKFRKAKNLDGAEVRAADFVAVPEKVPPGLPSANPKATRTPVIFIAPILIIIVLILGYFFWPKAKKHNPKIPELQIADSAAVMPVLNESDILFRYRTRERIIDDFEKAKLLLKDKKVNQSRYLLNQLIYSNADFQTREKAKIFLGFVFEPDFSDFNDNIQLSALFKNPKMHRDALVVVGGEVRDAISEKSGVLYQFIATSGGQEYRVHAFAHEAKQIGSKSVQVYGRFKGLVGEQKAIYLEALRVW